MLLDRRYLIKALQFGLNCIDLNDPVSPLRFYSQGKQMIVMPVRVEAAQSQPPTNRQQAVKPPAPPPERKPMISNPTPEEQPQNKSAIEEAIDLTHSLRDRFQDGVNQMKDLSLKLKLIHREQRTNSRELNSIRSSLRSLQGLKL